MHDSVVGEVVHSFQHAIHVVFYICKVHVVQIRQERLTLLVAEHERHLALESVALNELSNVIFAVQILEYQHFYQDKCSIYCWEDSLDGILANIAVFIFICHVFWVFVLRAVHVLVVRACSVSIALQW